MFHAAALATSFLKRPFVIKWINDLLPCQRQQYLYTQSPSASYPPACGCSNEDRTHFPRCQHVQRKQSWTTFVSSLRDIMERWSLDPGLRRILLHMTAPLSTLPPIPLTQLPDEYKMLLTTQCSIGTDSLLFRFFCYDWVRLQDRYLRARGLPSSQQEATRAIRSLIQLFHEQCHSVVGLLRNQHLHGTDPLRIRRCTSTCICSRRSKNCTTPHP
jgi:hypothetical protein